MSFDYNKLKLAKERLQKLAFVPVDPAAAGGAPMDPAAMGGAPMDPAMAGGMPPGDPAAMGGAPMDPAMAGGGAPNASYGPGCHGWSDAASASG